MVRDKDRAGREPAARESTIASGWTIEGDADAADAQAAVAEGPSTLVGAPVEGEGDGAGGAQQLSSGALVLLGLIGGVYLLYTMVWFSWASYYSEVNSAVAEGSGAIGAILQQLVFWLAPFAPALWFVSVLVLCRGAGTGRKLLWLLLGAVLLVPLPMLGGLI